MPAVFWNEIAQAPHQVVASEVEAALGSYGIGSQIFPGDLLAAPASIRNTDNRGLRVFAPFWRRVQSLGDPPKPLPAPKQIAAEPNLTSDALADWRPSRRGPIGHPTCGSAGNPARPQPRRGPCSTTAWPGTPAIAIGPTERAPGEKFAPDGTYVRRWVPELARLPKALIHQPWRATPLELASAGVELDKTYPHPIIDHKADRERALAAYAEIRNASMTAV